jgi:hypothetical protein
VVPVALGEYALPGAEGKDKDNKNFLVRVHLQPRDCVDGQQQYNEIRDRVEQAADFQNHGDVKALSRNSGVKDLSARAAFKDLKESCRDVKADHEANKQHDDDIERSVFLGREDATIEPQHRELGQTDRSAVFDRA